MVDILLATYNGAEYLRPQIYSIIAQSCGDWRLIVHDDGSTDSTVALVKEMAQQDSRIVLIDDGVRFGNAGENFMHLLKFSTADYVMFCDQDDVWFDNKVEVMLSAISGMNVSIPAVAYSNSYVWKPAEGIKGQGTLTFPADLRSLLFLNSGIQGCVAIFNARMREVLKEWQGKVSMHDHVLHLAGLTLGEVKYLPVPLMLYRQHANTVTPETRTRLFTLKAQRRNLRRPVVSREHFESVRKFFNIYKSRMAPERQILMQAFLELPEKHFFSRCCSIVKHRFAIYDSTCLLLTKVLLRPFI